MTRVTACTFSTGLALLLALCAPAEALTLSRQTTLSDDHGGRVVIDTQGSFDATSGEHRSVAEFSGFQAREAGWRIDGHVSRDSERVLDALIAHYSGDLRLQRDGAAPLSLRFSDLQVRRGDDGPVVSGSIEVNGVARDAATLGEPLRRLLRGVFRLLRA